MCREREIIKREREYAFICVCVREERDGVSVRTSVEL